jgi:type IV secretion system protein TrbB
VSVVMLTNREETNRRDMEALRGNFGPMVCARLDDTEVTDVMLNGDGVLFEDRKGVGLQPIGHMADSDALSIINQIASMAASTVNKDNPVFEGELPIRNARFIAFVPPYVRRPSFSIRLPSPSVYPLADYITAGIATYRQVEVIEDAIYRELNILVSGGTASGKTTLLNAIFDGFRRIHPRKRLCLIEEITEIQCLQPNVLALRTGPAADHQDLLKRLMRCRPDIIALGEVRDKAALQLMKAANTGHGSVISTVHANSPRSAPGRLEDLCAEGLPGVNLRNQIADALGVIVGISRIDPADRKPGEPERRITEIVKVTGANTDEYVFQTLA